MNLCLGVGILFLSFHEVTSLHPPSFHRNDYSTCSTHISFCVKQQSLSRARARRLYARACARGQRPPFYACVHAHVMASFSVCPRRAPRSTVGIYGERKTIAWCPCTPPSTMAFGEIISAEVCCGKEIAGLLI